MAARQPIAQISRLLSILAIKVKVKGQGQMLHEATEHTFLPSYANLSSVLFRFYTDGYQLTQRLQENEISHAQPSLDGAQLINKEIRKSFLRCSDFHYIT